MNLSVARRLLDWHDPERRDLPWKQTRDPYRIWLSEIILQQTRVAQGTPYYLRFVQKFPRVRDLAAAPLDDVLRLWEGLGYYSRARNLHAAARQVVYEFGGEFPRTARELQQLRGVGPYTAAAIASFAFGEPAAVVDGNVFRVLTRIFGIATPVDSSAGQREVRELADRLLDRDRPGDYNQAIMDFGALVCTPVSPDCDACPMRTDCRALQTGRVSMLPVKAGKVQRRHRHFHYFLITDGNRVLLHRRSDEDIWQGLYQLPLAESSGAPVELPPPGLLEEGGSLLKEHWPEPGNVREVSASRQVLSHQTIHARFLEVRVEVLPASGWPEDWVAVPVGALGDYALPRVVRRFLDGFAPALQEINRM